MIPFKRLLAVVFAAAALILAAGEIRHFHSTEWPSIRRGMRARELYSQNEGKAREEREADFAAGRMSARDRAVAPLYGFRANVSGPGKSDGYSVDLSQWCGKNADLAKFARAQVGPLSIDMRGPQFDDESLVYIAVVSRTDSLILEDTRVTDEGLKHLRPLARSLGALNLNRTSVTDAGLEHLTDFSRLLELYLADTQVTDAGVAEFQKAIPNCRISR